MKNVLYVLYAIVGLLWVLCFIYNAPFNEAVHHTFFQVVNASTVQVDSFPKLLVFVVFTLTFYFAVWFFPLFPLIGIVKLEAKMVRAPSR